MVDADVRRIARCIVMGQRELLPLFELYLALRELAETHLRSLCIEDERDDLPGALRRCTHLVDAREMLVVRAVREVEARTVHSALDERVDNSLGIRCRSLCAYDFRLFQHIILPRFLGITDKMELSAIPLSLKFTTTVILHSF